MELSNKLIIDNLRAFFIKAEETGNILSRKELKEMDTIDYSKMITDRVDSASLPSISLTDKEKEETDKCWYMILPPFKKGVIKPNRHRYIWFDVREVNEEDQSYIIELRDYAYESSVWSMGTQIIGYFKWDASLKTNLDGYHCEYSADGYSMADIVKLNMRDLALDKEKTFYYNEILLPALEKANDDHDFNSLLVHFALITIKTNMQLLEGKPKAIRGSGAKIKTSAGEVDKNPKPKIVRALSGGIQVKSVKIPKPISPDTVRTYTLEAWKSRGHVRHYKSGKTVWVKESIHHRKCLQTEDKLVVPQTIIKVG